MLSRGLQVGRMIRQVVSPKIRLQNVGPIRKGHAVSYRTGAPPHSKGTLIGAELVGAFMWWWVLWHLWHEYEHITGEFYYPDSSQWTNAELGIPSDDEE